MEAQAKRGGGDLAALVRRVGMEDAAPLAHCEALGFGDPARVVLGGRWDVFADTWAVLDEVGGLVCLQLYSSFNEFNRNRFMEDVYVDEFAAACNRL